MTTVPLGTFITVSDMFGVMLCKKSFEPRYVGLVVSVSTSYAVHRGFTPRSPHTKDHHKYGTNLAWYICVWL